MSRSKTFRTRRKRRAEKMKRKHGGGVRRHTHKGGRTGSIHAKQTRSKKEGK